MLESSIENPIVNTSLRPYLVCFSAALFFFYLVLQLAVFNTIGTDLMHALGIQTTMLSQLSATYLYTCSLFFLPAGLLFDRFSTNWFCGLYTGLMNLPLPILGALWGNLYLVQSKGYSPIAAGNLLSFIFVGLIFGPPLIGWISDKLGRRKPPILVSAICILLASLAIIYLNVSFFVLAILLFILGAFSGAQAMSYPVVIESNASEIESTSLGLISIVVNVIGAGSQIFLGWLITMHWNGALINGIPFYTTQNFKFALMLLPIGFLLSLIVGFFIRETFNKKI